MSDRTPELGEVEDLAREFVRNERNASIDSQLERIDRLAQALERSGHDHPVDAEDTP